MALDSTYKFREVKKATEVKPLYEIKNMKKNNWFITNNGYGSRMG